LCGARQRTAYTWAGRKHIYTMRKRQLQATKKRRKRKNPSSRRLRIVVAIVIGIFALKQFVVARRSPVTAFAGRQCVQIHAERPNRVLTKIPMCGHMWNSVRATPRPRHAHAKATRFDSCFTGSEARHCHNGRRCQQAFIGITLSVPGPASCIIRSAHGMGAAVARRRSWR
jgi:hypothetical protein